MLRFCLWPQFPFLHDPRPEVLDQYIHFVCQLLDDLTSFLLSHVYSDASPVAALQVTLDSHLSPQTVKFSARLVPALMTTCQVHDSAHCIHDADTETDNRPHDIEKFMSLPGTSVMPCRIACQCNYNRTRQTTP